MNTSSWIVLADGSEHAFAPDAQNPYNPDTLAHHLAQINRFTGATSRPYSVAEHSLLCADIAEHLGLPPAAQLACLTHDYHEAITGDMASPAKLAVGHAWKRFEQPQARALRHGLGLTSAFTVWMLQVHQIDLIALATERRDLMVYNQARNRPWPILDTPYREMRPLDWLRLDTRKREQTHWSEWRDALRERFEALSQAAKTEHAARIHQAAQEPQP